MGFGLNFLRIFILLSLLTPLEAAPGTPRCAALFKSEEMLRREQVHVETTLDEVPEIDVQREVVSTHFPPEGLAYIQSLAPFKVHHVERKFERETITSGQNYITVYQRWTPLGPTKGRILLQHGFSRSHRYFHDLRLLLLSFGYEVVAMDGANVGSTLQETLAAYGRFLRTPSPVDDALAWVDIIRHEKLHDFILVDHSRGHTIMTVLLGMGGRYARDLVLRFGLNPYINWLNDQYLDGNMIAGAATRAGLNQASIRGMKLGIAKSFDDAAPHESVDVPRYTQEQAVWQIGYGLMGEIASERGFSVLPFYDPKLSIDASDNGFGFKSPHVRLTHLSRRVLERTRILVSENDDVVTPSSVMPIIHLLPHGEAQLRTLRSASPPADHYAPSILPFEVAAYIDLEINRELARRRR